MTVQEFIDSIQALLNTLQSEVVGTQAQIDTLTAMLNFAQSLKGANIINLDAVVQPTDIVIKE